MDTAGFCDEYASTAEIYDLFPPYRDRADVGFFVEEALKADGPVLEIGCGTGRVLIPTARVGKEITGLDRSAAMLSICRRKLAQEPEEVRGRVTLVEEDMRHFDLGRRYGLATIPFRPFQHLITIEDQISCLLTIRRHLLPDGKLVLDLFNPSIPLLATPVSPGEQAAEDWFDLPDGRKARRFDRVVSRDHFRQVQDIELLYHVRHLDGREERLVCGFPMRYLFRFEAEHLLARCGFQVEALYSDYDRSPYGATYPGELIFVAVKAAED
ncbi:MAG: class I SAM-dependent methyltransferase [Anaerolineae bacterium]|nr:class I SAM-dependent methyltransferase [Anaerolineae bacterium]